MHVLGGELQPRGDLTRGVAVVIAQNKNQTVTTALGRLPKPPQAVGYLLAQLAPPEAVLLIRRSYERTVARSVRGCVGGLLRPQREVAGRVTPLIAGQAIADPSQIPFELTFRRTAKVS